VSSVTFWCKFAKYCCHKKHQKLSAQKLLCFDAKNVGEIDRYSAPPLITIVKRFMAPAPWRFIHFDRLKRI